MFNAGDRVIYMRLRRGGFDELRAWYVRAYPAAWGRIQRHVIQLDTGPRRYVSIYALRNPEPGEWPKESEKQPR